MVFMADVPLIDAIKMITTTPARILGISDKKGALAAGKDADIVLFDSSIEIEMTIIKGRVVYNRQAKIK
jgi:N-acetylglucosamine-6-phosphate deacetylase